MAIDGLRLFSIAFLFISLSVSFSLPDLSLRASTSYGITGIQSGRGNNDSVPFRLEIRQLQQNADQWNLYLLGLARFQSVDQAELLSFYKVAGIHGRPFTSWDGVQATSGDENTGYCTHSSILFPTWHRPYLALYEQVLYNTIQDVANEFEGDDHDRYTSAAADFRIPYWDWAASPSGDASVLPDSLTTPTVKVNTPNGTQTVNNPLFSYTFQPLNKQDLPNSPFVNWTTTLRYPTNDSINAVSQNNLVGQQLDNSQGSFKDRLYNLFTAYPDYTNVSNKGWYPNDGGNYDSFESLHDQIHGLVGSGGHMSIIDYSAFDPIFFLHHTMIDRSFAIWQALYPDSFVEPMASQYGTYTTSPGQTEDVNTQLTPFHQDSKGDLWTSALARSTKTFGYTYPELVDWNVTSDQYQSNVHTAVNKLYGGSSASSPQNRRRHAPESGSTALMRREKSSIQPISSILNKILDNGKYNEYMVNIRVQKYALQGSFFVHVFLGDFNPDPASWSFEPNLVGTHCIFVNDVSDKTLNSEVNSLQVSGVIPLTTTLLGSIAEGLLQNLDTDIALAFLKKNLSWRVTRLDNTHVENDQVPDLKVSVVSAQVTKATRSDEFPTWGSYTVHSDVTDGNAGGFNIGEQS
ncbi:MAG: hypothetical protein M4579_004883 [Chaenotheca gracillima]|nr:MAG: hypothetical protein M4579_004883 [Chaenotheca gracillima]